uniref:Tyrosine--tRNA ligase n=1 Tax=Candidatus Aschnera chinzeii TaxID=1485666 RepID=A0AAT9G4E9_9ENTR|nr:MAG: tyrosine--tRNA ligase [Candidatus Aschnera chinzeii]
MIYDNIIHELESRSLISQLICKQLLINKISQQYINLYCGFDPTADSLHIGHLPLLLCLKRFQKIGHNPYVLIGGATALIGDPSFKSKERSLHTIDLVQYWSEKIAKQITLFLDFHTHNPAVILNNYNWFKKIHLLDFLRDIGKYFSVNQMINKDAVKQRIQRNDMGISFTEFSYNLLQSYDFAKLNLCYNVELQIGGSDQWGNIVSGVDLVRRLNRKQVFGLTIPLITKHDGIKFGKSESKVIWLDPNKSSPYKFYQFWINTSDEDVYRFLKIFTYMSIDEIDELKNNNCGVNKISPAHYILAEKITKLVHGNNAFYSAKRISDNLFANSIDKLLKDDFEQLLLDGIPSIELPINTPLQDAVIKANFATSYTQARYIISSNGIAINGNKCNNPNHIFNMYDVLFDRFSLLKKGKKNYYLIIWK